jgi:hypothetical protein
MGLAVPDSAATSGAADTSAVATPQLPVGGTPAALDRLPGQPGELMGAPVSVESIDSANRLLIVRSPSGSRTTVRVVPTAAEFDTVKPGEQVLLDYYPSSLVSLGAEPSVAAAGDEAPTRANAPVLTAAGAGQLTAKARVTDVDSTAGALEITTAGGNPHAVTALDPATRSQLRSLHDGDRVTVTYTEAVAVGVHPVVGD